MDEFNFAKEEFKKIRPLAMDNIYLQALKNLSYVKKMTNKDGYKEGTYDNVQLAKYNFILEVKELRTRQNNELSPSVNNPLERTG